MRYQTAFLNANVIFPDRVQKAGAVALVGDRIGNFGDPKSFSATETIDLEGKYLSPGFVDLHVHGGGGADFMDLTPDAFRRVCQSHAKHGTTALTPTSTVAAAEDYDQFLALCQQMRGDVTTGARVVGSHLYGPYFLPAAKGCHPNAAFLRPAASQVAGFHDYDAAFPLAVTIAPELPDAETLTRACRERGIHVNIGHSYATMEQVEAAVGWGARHVDHLFCAMSDRARLRQQQAFPMRAGLLETTLVTDQLTTEVIADGKHLADSLLRVAYKLKGPDRLALVTDTMRAMDMPDGEYWFGPEGSGERIRRLDGAGVTLDGSGLASGVMGMDYCVRTMKNATKAPLHEIIRMASLTPAKIIGLDQQLGSIEVGKRADLVVLDAELQVEQVYVGGHRVH
ncbi:N-acetylglucosamine-6-phosphate deacetylase [Limnoglobus roseus]|uniref:N-acetylglucosamine-6-phosphate deacetylase n=1 Tax=Limnoglobus roseus TaxID=2598579 RepID=A0A5C1AG97_9BACT|nr:N-acetylglucosamine-6-phosphate deacetylase [Limnoglobus roseus]QEL18449.1 N-acetylglucosamine-6-phosphate deacetylase [Limnoglobus roseus]